MREPAVNHDLTRWTPGFTPQDVAALSSVTEGPVLLAGSEALADEIGLPDGAICEPDIAVVALNAADVAAAVRFAVDFRLPLAVASPGHPVAAKEGVLVATHRMNRIHVDSRTRTALAGAGALWADVVARAAELGLAPLVPAYPRISVVGPEFGWTAGHVLAVERVTPEGRFEYVTPVSDPRLFPRLCRSAVDETDLGVITALEFRLFR